jgi:hypothetical protein
VIPSIELDALPCREIRLNLGLLEDDPDAVSPKKWGRLRVLAEHTDVPRIAPAISLENLDGGRFSRTIRPQERNDLTLPDVEIDPGDGHEVAVGLP